MSLCPCDWRRSTLPTVHCIPGPGMGGKKYIVLRAYQLGASTVTETMSWLQDRMTHCPLCRKRVLEDSASGPSATAPATAAAAAAAATAQPANQAAVDAVPQPPQPPPPANGDSTVEQDAALAAALAAAEAAVPAAPARRSVSLSSNDSTRRCAVSANMSELCHVLPPEDGKKMV